MEAERWQRLLSVFDDALEVAAEVRPTFVRSRCGGDEGLASDVERMLAAHESDEGFMSRPAFAPAEDAINPGAGPSPGFGYRVIRTVGSGGMGMVYLAEQLATGREVALKVVGPWAASQSLLRRFEYEVRTLAQLQHTAIAQMYEAGSLPESEGSRPFFAMEYVEGTTLTKHAAAKQLTTLAKLDLFLRVCEGVSHAHHKGVIHRDLKPANILVTESGSPKILDFGVSRIVGDDPAYTSLHTREGQIVGTLAYMSPEQVAGNAFGMDTRSDVYALGVILHELLTGSLPYQLSGKGLAEAARIIKDEPPALPSSTDRSFRGDLDVIVGKCLEKEREQRYDSVAEVAADIQRHLRSEVIVARPAGRWQRLAKFTRRNRVAVFSGGLVVLALLLGIGGTSWQAMRAGKARKDAVDARDREHQAALTATARAAEAERKSRVSESVTGFLQDLLTSASPEDLGRDAKVTDVIARADAKASQLSDINEVRGAVDLSLGIVFAGIGDLRGALERLERALEELSTSLGADDPLTLRCMQNLALARATAGDLVAAEEMMRTVLEKRSRSPKTEPGTLIMSQLRLSQVLCRRNKIEEAETLAKEALATATASLGETHESTLEARYAYSEVLRKQHRVQEAMTEVNKLVAAWAQTRGEQSAGYLESIRMLCVLLAETESDPARISSLLTDKIETFESVFGPSNPRTLEVKELLASGLIYSNPQRAQEIYQHLVDARTGALGRRHDSTMGAITGLTLALQSQKKYEEAEVLLREVLDAARSSLGPDHMNTSIATYNLARCEFELTHYDQAESLLRESIRIADRAAAGTWVPAQFRLELGRCLGRMKKFEEGERLLLNAHEGLVAQFGMEHFRSRDASRAVSEFYIEWGKPEQAAQFKQDPSPPSPQ